ncbi:MAG: hypothetical protein ACREQW_11495 [Candidatus Binatia bacterium]
MVRVVVLLTIWFPLLWQRWAPLPTARHGLGVAAIGNTIYVISGGPKPGASFSTINEAFTP